MVFFRVLSRIPRAVSAHCRNSLLLSPSKEHHTLIICNQLHSLLDSPNRLVTNQVSLLHHSVLNASTFQRCGISSSASPQPTENQPGKEHGSPQENNGASTKASVDSGEAKTADQTEESDSEDELSKDDLVKLVAEKEALLEMKQKDIEKMQDKVLRSYAEMENVMDRTRREAENSKKFAIQSFAKSLLDVADNLGRASAVVKESFAKIDVSKDTAGAVPLLKTLLEGVEMTDKQLAEVFRKFGVEKFDPINEQFDPNRHNASFQISDPSKPPGTVAVILKSGYMLYDRVIRPADVGVTEAVNSSEAEGSEA